MNNVNKRHVYVIISFIVGVCVGIISSRFNKIEPYLDDPNMKTWTYRIVHSPDNNMYCVVVDTETYSFYFRNREDVDRLHKEVFDFIYQRTPRLGE